MDKEQAKNLLNKINEELDLLAKMLNNDNINYIAELKNLEMKIDQDGKNYKELKIEISLIERIK